MIVLAAKAVTKHYGPEPVLDGVSFEMRPGERIGLVGPNGVGKTTLLRILAGKEEADAGNVEMHPSVRLEYLEQQPVLVPGRTLWDEARSALAELISLGHELEAVAHAMGQATEPDEHRRLARRFDHLQHELHRQDAYNLDHKIERVLHGLGFPEAAYRQPIEQLSGGQQNRLMLVKLLLAEPDVMLLDEPSNHLDVEATEWLETFLADSRQAMLVVSHDRYFLDKVTNQTLELYRGTVESYTGNFSAYWRQKAERLLVQTRTYEKQQIAIAKTEDFIRRNFYGQKHAQAEDRRKKLARIERVAPPREIAAPPMGFRANDRSGDIVLRADRLAKGYDRPLFAELSFEITRGQRWGILGPNGSGKTTLLRCLLAQERPDAGCVSLGTGVEPGYFDQLLASLDSDVQVVDSIRPPGKEFTEPERRNLLARFGLKGDSVLQTVGSLSGGERTRAALARLAAMDANFLVLDEPTNHLDLWARDALERSLTEFEDTVLFVSHDRYFLNRVADHLLVVEPGRFRTIEGNYDTYLHMASLEPAAAPPISAGAASAEQPSPPPRRSSSRPAKPKRRFPYRKVADLETEIFERETRIAELHERLAQPDVHRNGDQVREVKAEIADQQESLRQLYEHWEEATELN
ncbi:MAG: ABC-F family ATP-binding cassette domain-containing protein [Pirellulales bacterium]